MLLDKNYWEERYLSGNTPWDIGKISTPIKDYFQSLENKNIRILIPGAGNSYEAEYLFNNGFQNVYVLDFSEEALKKFSKRCPDFPSQQLISENFFSHNGKYDLIIEQTFFCALNPELRTNYVLKMHQLLKPGGKLCGLLFNDPELKGNPPFGGSSEEYIHLFKNNFEIIRMEKARNSITPRMNREVFFEIKSKHN